MRSLIIIVAAPSPTPLIAASPKRMPEWPSRTGGECGAGFVDVGAEYGQMHGAALIEKVGNFIGVALFGGKDGSHELNRVVRLEVGGSVAEHGVSCGVRFIKAVFGKFLKEGENSFGVFPINVVGVFGALNKDVFLGIHDFLNLLAHGTSEDIGSAKCVSGNNLSRLHNLFLIDEYSVSFLYQVFEQGMGHLNSGGVFLAPDEVGDKLHRAGPIKSNERDDFFKGAEANLSAKLLHSSDSNWKTPVVRPLLRRAKVAASFREISSMSKSGRSGSCGRCSEHHR